MMLFKIVMDSSKDREGSNGTVDSLQDESISTTTMKLSDILHNMLHLLTEAAFLRVGG